MFNLSLEDIESAARVVYAHMEATPAIRWPLLCERVGAEVWVKHENHTPIGAFKLRGGLYYMSRLREEEPDCPGVITATRGNHGQSIACAATLFGVKATVLVPRGNNPEKNAAMRAFGAELIEHGADFQEARERAQQLSQERGLRMISPYHPWLVQGVASLGLEFLRAHPDLEVVYVPVGMGSSACGMIAARDALDLDIEIVGAVADRAPCYALSFEAGECVSTESSDTLADGVACRTPDPDAVAMLCGGASRILRLAEQEFEEAMRIYFSDTHNVAEGAGAAALAALLREREQMAGRKVGVVHSGGNVDSALLSRVLAG